jgi:hypothetical protein
MTFSVGGRLNRKGAYTIMEITQALIEELKDDGITVKRNNEIKEAIAQKVGEIWRFICQESKRKMDWWMFSNGNAEVEGDGGEFDPRFDAKFIDIDGPVYYSKIRNDPYKNGFHTELLWDKYWRQTVVDTLEAAKKKDAEEDHKRKETNETRKKIRKVLIDSIKKKLTKEELKIIKFKD